tara:strand:- start:32632 stop:32913 length:282 start_codon:yes stop_codon:yes gene_type:complete
MRKGDGGIRAQIQNPQVNKMKVTKSQLRNAIRETLNELINESEKGDPYSYLKKRPQSTYLKSFKKMYKKLAMGPVKNTKPFTEKPTIGKSGPS